MLRSGDEVRITAQLIEANSDRHLWSQSYEGELRDTLTLQNKVARAIVDQIRINLNPQEQAAPKNVTKRTADGLRVALAYSIGLSKNLHRIGLRF